MKIKYFICLLMVAAVFCGCAGDDVNEIFTGKKWHWSNSYTTADWENDNKDTGRLLSLDELKDVSKSTEAYNLMFNDDGTLQGVGKNFQFSAKWEADGKKNTFALSQVRVTQGNPSSKLDSMFYASVKNACYYRGNSILWIKLFNSERNEYIMFSNNDYFEK